ncbi:MAG: Mpo1-like protein [Phycisphaerae bacterium]
MRAWLHNWRQRHQHRVNLALHAVGIPMLAAGLILGLVQLIQGRWDLWWRPVSLIAASYLIQWTGHRIEGNDVGEVIPIKKLLGMPYIAVSPRYRPPDADRTDRITR